MDLNNINLILNKCHFIILGAGPAGLSAADYLVSSGKSVVVIDRGSSYNKYYSATGRYELIQGMRAGGIGGATQQWGGQLLRLGKSEYENWSRLHGFETEILNDLEKESDFILNKFKIRIPRFNGEVKLLGAKFPTCYSQVPKEIRLSQIFSSTLNSPLFHYLDGMEIVSIGSNQDKMFLTTTSGTLIQINEKYLMLALGTIENTALLIRSIPNFSDTTYYHLGKNLQDHPHGILFEIEGNLFCWYRNYKNFGLNKKYKKTKFQYQVHNEKFIKGGIAEIHLIDTDMTFRNQLKIAFQKRSIFLISMFIMRVISTLLQITTGRKILFQKANIWFQYEQNMNESSMLRVSPSEINFRWCNSQADLDFVSSASSYFREFFESKGFKTSKVRVFHDSLELDSWTSEACHPSGTIPLSKAEDSGVADYYGKIHTIPRCYLLGASLFPTSGWFNPTLLIMAYSRLVASKILKTKSD